MAIPETLLSEYRLLTEQSGLVGMPGRTKIELRGDDRAAFLHNFCTNDIKRLKPGEGCEAFICNVKGHVLNHVQVFCGEESLWIDAEPGQASPLLAHLDRYLIREKVELLDRSDDFAEFIAAGPQVGSALMEVTESLPLWSHTAFQWRNAVLVRRIDLGAVPAYALLFNRSVAGEEHHFDLPICSSEALEMVRIEAGFPRYGIDITNDNLPQEVARDAQAISFIKGCYLGQETVARIDALGHVNRTLCRVAIAGEEVPPPGAQFTAEGKAVGTVTSAAWSPRLGQPLALAYMRRGHNTVGQTLQSVHGLAKVVAFPHG